MYERILLVCTGNICRSPLAEAMFRAQIAGSGRRSDAQVRSAGVKTVRGKPVDESVLYVAQSKPELTASLSAHRSQPIDATLTWWADLILVMEPSHAKSVLQLDASAKPKVHLLGAKTGRLIVDPYMRHESVYREVQDLIAAAVGSWRQAIDV